MNVWVSTVESSLAFFSDACPQENCDVNNHFDMQDSTTLEGPLISAVKSEKAQLYSGKYDGKVIYPNVFHGSVYQDSLQLLFQNDKTEANVPITAQFMAITKADQNFQSQYDGFLGLAPYIGQSLDLQNLSLLK
jgi:hypothetical protein